jgi:hypothetical protein
VLFGPFPVIGGRNSYLTPSKYGATEPLLAVKPSGGHSGVARALFRTNT